MTRSVPQNIMAEEALIGALLIKEECVAVAVESVSAEDFYSAKCATVFTAVVECFRAGTKVDAVSVADVLKRNGTLDKVGGSASLIEMISGSPSHSESAAHAYCKIIKDYSLLRATIGAADRIVEEAYGRPQDVGAFLVEAENSICRLSDGETDDSAAPVSDILIGGLQRLDRMFQFGDEITGLPTGLFGLDDILSGLQPGAMYVLGARPSMGKSAVAACIASHVALRVNRPVVMFSLEMSQQEILQRLMSIESRVGAKRIKTGNMYEDDWDRLLPVLPQLQAAPLVIDDSSMTTLNTIRSKARRVKQQYGDLGLVIVDYLQLMSGPAKAGNREQEVSMISRGMKMLARELDCAVLVLSQLNRGLELRADKRPVLSDLRESGSQEQDADVVMFLYRDEMYNRESDFRGITELIVAKHRAGSTGTVYLGFMDYCTKFLNMANAGDE